jgi:hypothetical protein
MDFVDDVDLVTALIGCEVDSVSQIANVFNARIRGRIDLHEIQKTTFSEGYAMLALVAWSLGKGFVQAVDCLGQQASRCGFACAAWSGKKVGMRHTPSLDCITQREEDMILANNFIPSLRSPTSVKCLSH